jgi:hypothetical protein
MANNANSPAAATEAFELPPTAAVLNQNRKDSKGVSWSATPRENDAATIEQRKMPVKYELQPNLSIKTVLKDTHTRFKDTDKAFLMISKFDSTIVIKTAEEFDKISPKDMEKLFPGEIINGKTWVRLFVVSTMNISRLKKSSYGYYAYAN